MKAKAADLFADSAARKERMRREAGIPEGVDMMPNGSIADPDIHLQWLIGRIAASGGTSLFLNRSGTTCLPAEIGQLAPSLRKLKLLGQAQNVFDGIGMLVNLEEIDLANCAVDDLSPLADCPHLKSLKISGAPEGAFASFPDLPELVQLTVGGGSVAGLTASLPKLEQLDLSWCSNVPPDILKGKPRLRIAKLPTTEVEPKPASDQSGPRELVHRTDAQNLLSDIGAMTGLTSLTLNATEASDLSPIAALKNLTYLHLRAPKAASLAPLKGLHALETLIIPSWRDEAVVSDLSWLSGCPVLTDLRISITADADLNALDQLPPLEYLKLGFSDSIDLSALGTLASVKSLFLQASPPKASPRNLALPGKLKQLSLSGSSFTSLDALAFAPGLTALSLTDCRITDLSPLKTQTELTSLSLYRSAVRDLSVLRHLPAFTAPNTTAQLNIHQGTVLDAYPSLRPYVENANHRDARSDAMPNLVRAAVALVS